MLAKTADIHVPKFCPKIIGIAITQDTGVARVSACKIPIEAEELWIIIVIIIPTAKPKSGLVKAIIAFLNPCISANGAIESDISSIPNIKIAKPISIVPTFLRLLVLDAIIKITPINAKIGEKDSGFNNLKINPALSWIAVKLNIHAVIVVPKLAPIITLTVLDNVIIPEFTRPMSITVTAEDDWIIAVIIAPNVKLFKGFDVIFFNICSSLPPATFSKPDDIIEIP